MIDEDARLYAIRPAWDALWRSVGTASPFLSSAWLLAWWRAFGNGRARVAVASDEDGRLCGLLPLYSFIEDGAPRYLPLGVGLSDYTGALIDPAAPPWSARVMLAAVLARAAAEGIPRCDLVDLPPNSALRDVPIPIGWETADAQASLCPQLDLAGTTDGLQSVVRAGMLRKLRMARHRMARRDPHAQVVCASEPAEVMRLWQALIAHHRARWTRRGEPGGVLADVRVLEFHRRALPLLCALGVVKFYALISEGQIAAVYYTLHAGDSLAFYLSGFDEAFAFESAGTVLMGAIAEQTQRDGVRTLDFLRGIEDYKLRWGAQPVANLTRRLSLRA